MKIFDAFLLGAVQGLTEFLPISSSGHLVILERLLGVKGDLLFMNVLFHGGSLLSLLFVFRRELFAIAKGFFFEGEGGRAIGWALVGALIPTGIIGILLEDRVALVSLRELALFYFLTSLLLFSLKYLRGIKSLKNVTFKDGFFIGLAQGMGVFPGLSRSGVTIFGGAFIGLELDSAIRFSFLLAVPTIGGAFLLEIKKMSLSLINMSDVISLIIGFASSFLFSLLSIRFLLKGVVQKRIHWFSFYCLFLGVILLLATLG